MTYRDDLEGRSARVAALQAELDRLEHEETAVDEALRARATLADRLLGGVLKMEERIELDVALDEVALQRVLAGTFGVDGMSTHEGDALVWRAEPEPRPRKIVARATITGGRTTIVVEDVGSRRDYGLFGSFAMIAGQLPNGIRNAIGGQVSAIVLLGAFALLQVVSIVFVRSRMNTRAFRRARQQRALALACSDIAREARFTQTRVGDVDAVLEGPTGIAAASRGAR